MHRLHTCYNLSMRITYDSVADATYVYLKEDAKIKGTISINGCYIDIDMDGHVVGIEYLHCPVIEVDGVAVDLASFRKNAK